MEENEDIIIYHRNFQLDKVHANQENLSLYTIILTAVNQLILEVYRHQSISLLVCRDAKVYLLSCAIKEKQVFFGEVLNQGDRMPSSICFAPHKTT